MKKLRKRLMSWLMVVAVVFSTFAPFIPMTVSAATYSLTVHDRNITDNIVEGYDADNYIKFISLLNTSDDTLYTSKMDVSFDNDNITLVSFNNSTTLNVGDTYNSILYIKPKAGLTAGNYETIVTIKYDVDSDNVYETTLGTGKVTFKVLTSPLPKHDVTYMDGSNIITTIPVIEGNPAFVPADPTKDWYVFEGWYAESSLTNPFDFTAPITAPINVYAKFIPATYSLTVHDRNITDSIVVGYNADDYVKFISLKNTSNIMLDTSKMDVSFDNDNITLVSFNNSTTLNVGDTFNSTLNIKPKAGLGTGNYETIVTIKYDVDGDNVYETTLGTGKVTFKVMAAPLPKYDVTYMDGSNIITTIPVTEGNPAFVPADPTKDWYVFEGWYAESSLTNPFDFTAPITAPINVYAKFMPATYSLTVHDRNITDSIVDGYNPDDYVKFISLKNTSNIMLDTSKMDVSFDNDNITLVSFNNSITLNVGDTFNSTLNIKPKAGLGTGNYETIVTIKYDVDGDNVYETTLGTGKVTFKVNNPTDPSGTNTGGSTNTGTNTNNNTSSPQTSDNIVFYIMTMLLSLFGIAGASVYVNRKKLFNR